MTVLAIAILALCARVHGGDWPQWNGPKRDGHADEKSLLKEWPKAGPKLLWTFDKAGTGYTAPAVVGGNVYTMGCRGEDEFVICLDAKGTEQWATKIGPVFEFKTNQWSRGPNGTPAVDGNLLYALGSQGTLVCLDTEKGTLKWKKDLPKDMAAEVSNVFGGPDTDKFGWGYCWSPLVDADYLIITPGGPKGLVAALDKKSGNQVWRSTTAPDEASYPSTFEAAAARRQATYSSPIVAEVDGVRQYIVMVQDGAVGVLAKDGSELWRFRRDKPFPDVVCPTPVYHDGHLFLTATDGGCHLVKLTKNGAKFDVKDVYTRAAGREMSNDVGGVLLVDGCLYGATAKTQGWRCMQFADGKRKWSTRELGNGAGVYADGLIVVVTQEDGEVVLMKADPKECTELSRFTLPKMSMMRRPGGRVWTHPVIADGKLYLRDQELIFCYDLKK
jgi:outer membrane protein assembly factor BamB